MLSVCIINGLCIEKNNPYIYTFLNLYKALHIPRIDMIGGIYLWSLCVCPFLSVCVCLYVTKNKLADKMHTVKTRSTELHEVVDRHTYF